MSRSGSGIPAWGLRKSIWKKFSSPTLQPKKKGTGTAWGSPEKFDLILTDMTMPRMTGDKLARAVKEIRPDIPVILCTGFSERLNQNAHGLRVDGVLMQPVNKREMAIAIRELFDKGAGLD